MSTHLPANSVTLTPLPRAPEQFAREAQADFLDALAEWGNVRAAAKRAGVSRSTAYRMRRACPHFAQLWDAALVLARPRVEEVLADRALNGTRETVYYHGEEVATRTRYDPRLLLAHLGRLDRLAGDRGAREASFGFDDELEHLVALHEIAFEDGAEDGAEGGAEDRDADGVEDLDEELDETGGDNGMENGDFPPDDRPARGG